MFYNSLYRAGFEAIHYTHQLLKYLTYSSVFIEVIATSFTADGVQTGFTKFTQLHVVTSQFVMVWVSALRARIEDRTGSRHDFVEVNSLL